MDKAAAKQNDNAAALLPLNPALDPAALAAEFAIDQRIQIRDVLEPEAASAITKLLVEQTPWGLSWQAGNDGPHRIRSEQLPALGPQDGRRMADGLTRAMQGDDFAFVYSQYRMSKAVIEGWSKSPAHDALVSALNGTLFLDFIRTVTALPEIRVCDAQASHYGPNQFLSLHQDISVEENEDRLVAYVLNLVPDRWRPDWGGYLNFFDEAGDISHGYMPRFNCLNLFRVPRHHNVSYVAPFAAGNRLAVTGWFRTR
ncbi:MAG: 2OG-Fe(II) oxygenase family protein [Sphingomicrobium sp.]